MSKENKAPTVHTPSAAPEVVTPEVVTTGAPAVAPAADTTLVDGLKESLDSLTAGLKTNLTDNKKIVIPSVVVERGGVKTNARGIKERTDKLQNGNTVTTFLFADASDETAETKSAN